MSTNATPSADPGPGPDAATDVRVPPTPSHASRPARRRAYLRRRLVVADVLAGAVAGVATALVAGASPVAVGVSALAVGAAWPVLTYACGLYAVDDLDAWVSGIREAPRLALCCLAGAWPMLGLLAAVQAPRPVAGTLVGTLVAGGCTAFARAVARARAHQVSELRERTIIVGSGIVARRLVERLRHHPERGLDPIGFLDDDIDRDAAPDVPHLGGLEALRGLLRADVDRVMIAFTRSGHEDLLRCLRVCRDAGVTVDVVPRLFDFLDGAQSVERLDGIPLLSISVPSLSRWSWASKRTLDLVGATAGLVVLAPLLALAAVAIRLDSPGPAVFAQTRMGRDGRTFRMYKLRSMHRGASVEMRAEGGIVKSAEDGRVTRVGRVIRRFSFDEVLQLVNVVRGDMSLVGPRPIVLLEAAVLEKGWQERRANLRPGMTGPWQVYGRSNLPFQDMIRLDYQYVAGWSLARDARILLATVPAVLAGRGAY